MSIRCSLLGHSYGDAEIEREREEQGSEVVVTVREFEECERCGERKVISENKEVTALDSPAPDLESAESDAALDQSGPAGQSDSTDRSDRTGVHDEEVPAGEDDAEILDDSTDADPSAAAQSTDGPAASSADSGATGQSADAGQSDAGGDRTTADRTAADTAEATAVDSAEGVEQSAADDDGVILDDDGDAGDDGRTPGAWPEAETTHPAEADDGDHAEWPEVGREDDGFDAEPDDGASADVEFGGGLTPESGPEVDADETDEVEFVNAEGDALRAPEEDRNPSEPELSSGISAGADAPTLAGPAEDPDVDAEFVCPECDYREGVAGSSLRAGDICPECARGYLAQE